MKLLEWRDRPKADNRFGDVVADSVAGQYVIRPWKGGFRLWLPDSDYNEAKTYAGLDDAKAAAQSDYERHILSALEPAAPQFEHSATNDQIAAVMLQHGNEDQRREALAYAGIAAPEGRREAVGVAPAQNELDFAAAIAEVVKEESASGAACGWHPCTGCHETNEGYETGLYPYSKLFGCYVGSGCSECGGLGVVWEYFSEADLDAMSRRIDTDVATHANPARVTVDALAQEIRRVDGNHDLGAGALAEALWPFLAAAIGAGAAGKMVEPAAPEGRQDDEPRAHELSGNTGELIDKMAEAIRGDTTSDDTPWATLSEDRKIGWRGDAERALAVVKHYLTARRPSEAMVEAASIAIQHLIPGWLTEDGSVEDHHLARAAIKAAMEAGR